MKYEIGLSQRAYAKRRGVSPKAVRNALGSEAVPGRIRDALLPDGTIDADLADRLWEANTDPSQRRGKEAERAAASMRAAETRTASPPDGERDSEDDGEEPVPTPPPRRKETFEEDPPRFRPSADVADALEEHVRRNRGEDDEGDDEEGGGEFADNPTMLALAIKEKREKVRKLRLANDKEEGTLVTRAQTWGHFYAFVAGISEAWQVWPDKVGPELAGKYGADAFAFTQDLKEAVREQLKALAGRDAKAPAGVRKDG